LSVRFGALDDPAGSLSGCNQQRLAIACELEREPKLLVAAQPTRGVDIAGTAFIHRLLAAFRDRGGAILLVSESLEEILALSDRILCLFKGRIGGELGREEASLAALGRMMIGQRAA
ncbi:MAG TPA: heme ABC transporter ATP-binding protein, partial [Roseiarcus sp.]|nr:heme ABC transporter ATP-binding protein [Roseiarcus sp.]